MGCVKAGKERISCPDYIYKNWISKEDIINYWKARKPFSELPYCNIPNYKDKEWYRKEIVPLIVALGAIPKDQLKVGQWYKGDCRNSRKAKWDGEKFVYERYKWGSTYWDDIDHFDSDTCYDVFIPFEEIKE